MPTIDEQIGALRQQLQDTKMVGGASQRSLWEGTLELLEDISNTLHEIEENQDDLNLYLETIDNDLTRMENHFFNLSEDEEETPSYIEYNPRSPHGGNGQSDS